MLQFMDCADCLAPATETFPHKRMWSIVAVAEVKHRAMALNTIFKTEAHLNEIILPEVHVI